MNDKTMTGAEYLEKWKAVEKLRSQIAMLEIRLLHESGWKRSCDYPGSLWLWSKDFPESKVQWRWKPLASCEREPVPARSYAGVTTEIAMIIEDSWRRTYVPSAHRERLPEPEDD